MGRCRLISSMQAADSCLALARAGATELARKKYSELGLARSSDEDIAALDARLQKDQALAAAGADRRKKLEHAAGLYRKIYERTGGTYPGVNAATLSLLSGDTDSATALAKSVITKLEQEDAALNKPASASTDEADTSKAWDEFEEDEDWKKKQLYD